MDLNEIKEKALEEAKAAQNAEDLAVCRKKYLGKKGELTKIFSSLKNSSQKAETGEKANELKKEIVAILEEKEKSFKTQKSKKREALDITIPAEKVETGHLHPLTLIRRKIEEIFQGMGFSVAEGPEIETEFYNFDALNIPKEHPARDLWDTFYLKDGTLLRTHTSPVQIRYMEKNNPPLRIIAPGRIYRHEATDASHDFQFYQVEGLMVGDNISVANFRAIIQEFLSQFFRKAIKIRLRPGYFPFTEPSFEVDIACIVCKGRGCSVCSNTGWLELIGAGMVHPNVLKSSGLNPKNWQGFAFGIGMDRLAMMKYRIDDIRLFRSGDTRFLEQF